MHFHCIKTFIPKFLEMQFKCKQLFKFFHIVINNIFIFSEVPKTYLTKYIKNGSLRFNQNLKMFDLRKKYFTATAVLKF